MSKLDIRQFSGDVVRTDGAFDGQVRKLSQAEFGLVQNHFIRLDRDSLYNRFGSSVSDEMLARHVDSMRNSDTAIFGCCILGRIRGIAELRQFGSGQNRQGEAALTVERGYRDLGIEHALMAAMIDEARRARLSEILVCFDVRDRHMRRLSEQFQASRRFEETDCFARITIEDCEQAAA
jgi:GNAT superfamily N-acetyltransferase